MTSKNESFPEFFKAYSHLREKNWVVRSGDQYGVDFVAYRHHPSLVHSEYGVLVLREGNANGNTNESFWISRGAYRRLGPMESVFFLLFMFSAYVYVLLFLLCKRSGILDDMVNLFFMAFGLVYAFKSINAETEYRGVANAVVETCWLRNLLRELHTPLSSTTFVYCDNVSAVYLSCNPVQHQCTKHIEIDIHFVHDLVAVGQVRVLHVPSRFQYADIFTKGLPSTLFEEFCSSLSVRRPLAPTQGEGRVYILRFKHEAFGNFKEWKQLVENQTKRTVKKLRTDNGLEFCNRRKVVFNESVIYKDTLKDSGASDKSVEELQVEVDLQKLNNHTPEEDQPPDLTDYHLVRDREPRTRTKPLRFRDKSNMAFYAFIAAEEEDTHEPLTY
nr:ribonuclease H-like domain-containing protein [Tanacetum cinerariifolium]